MTIHFVSGHLDLTKEEFEEHYVPQLQAAVERGDSFVVGDARGCDFMAQQWLVTVADRVRVFHMFEHPRLIFGDVMRVGGFKSDKERDAAMTAASDADIAWVRPGREKSGTAKNIARRSP